MDFDKEKYTFEDLTAIIKRLTAGDGCPWDKVQTHKSIRINMIEEAYEAVDAIDKNDTAAMREEFGDILLQAVLHADIASRNGEFDINDVITGLCNKLIQRHTHIFGSDKAENAAEALRFWEGAKAKEKNQKSVKQKLEELPALPSALKAQKICKKLDGQKELDKVLKEFNEVLLSLKDNPSDFSGRFLFLAVSIVTLLKQDAEAELNDYCNRLIKDYED